MPAGPLFTTEFDLKSDLHTTPKAVVRFLAVTLLAAFFFLPRVYAFLPPGKARLPDFDTRLVAGATRTNVTVEQHKAVESLKKRLGNAAVEFDKVTGSPKSISAGAGFFTGPEGAGKAVSPQTIAVVAPGDTNKAVKAFLLEHKALFGFGPEALDKAKVTRANEAAHNGLRTVVWEQQVQGIPVFEAVFISHTTKRGELVNVASQFMRDPETAALPSLKARMV